MSLLHKIVGVAVVVIFLLTGQYLKFYYPQMSGLGDGARMMLRSRHIYILLAGLVNIGVGTYFSYWNRRWRKALQLAGSALIILASGLLIGAFFYEPELSGLQRFLTLPGIIALFGGTLFHLLSGIGHRRDSGSA